MDEYYHLIDKYKCHPKNNNFKCHNKNKKKSQLSFKRKLENEVIENYDCNMDTYDDTLEFLENNDAFIGKIIHILQNDYYGEPMSLAIIENILLDLNMDLNEEVFMIDDMKIVFEHNHTVKYSKQMMSFICIKIFTLIENRKLVIQHTECQNGECYICLDENVLLHNISCKHAFCKTCIGKLTTHKNCPMCRVEMDAEIVYDSNELIPLSKQDQNKIVDTIISLRDDIYNCSHQLSDEFENLGSNLLVYEITSHLGIYNQHLYVPVFELSTVDKLNNILTRFEYLKSKRRQKLEPEQLFKNRNKYDMYDAVLLK